MSFIAALRIMLGCAVPVINLGDMRYGELKCDKKTVDDIKSHVRRYSPDFYPIYEECFSKKNFTVEDVFNKAVFTKFDKMTNLNAIDVQYANITLHLRIVVDGIDTPTEHGEVIENSRHIVSNNSSTVAIELDKFRLDEKSEYWEYYVTM